MGIAATLKNVKLAVLTLKEPTNNMPLSPQTICRALFTPRG
jgi:hypothetical protein